MACWPSIWERLDDDRRARPVDLHCDDRGGILGYFMIWGKQRHLLWYRDPVGDAGAGVFPWTDGRAGMAWPRAAERLQRHEGHGPARHRRFLHRGIRALLHGGADRDRLPGTSDTGKFPHRQRDRCHARGDPQRAEMLGYDVRKYQLLTFVIGSGLRVSAARSTRPGGSSSPRPSIGLPKRRPCRSCGSPSLAAATRQPRWSARSCSCSASRPSPSIASRPRWC